MKKKKKINTVIENKINRIFERSFGKNNINPNSKVLIPTNANPISGKEPPYSCKMDLPESI